MAKALEIPIQWLLLLFFDGDGIRHVIYAEIYPGRWFFSPMQPDPDRRKGK